MVVIEQLIAQIVHFIACKLLLRQQTDVVRQRSPGFAFLAGKREIRTTVNPKLSTKYALIVSFSSRRQYLRPKGMARGILRVVNIETLVNIIERFVLLQSAAINTIVVLTVDIHSVIFQILAV